MSRAEAQNYDRLLKIPWQAWEKKVAAAYKMNGWKTFQDRTRPTKDKKIHKARQGGKPDFEGRKHFEGYPHKALMVATQYFHPGGVRWVIIECKTGSAVPTKGQQEYIDDVNATPGMFGMVAFPWDFDRVIEILGGERGL